VTSTTTTKNLLRRSSLPRANVAAIGVLLLFTALAAGALAIWSQRDRGVQLSTVVADASGMHDGKPVLLAGVKVGEIDHIELTDENRARVYFHVDSAHARRLRADEAGAHCKEDPSTKGCGARVETTVELSNPLDGYRGLILRPGSSRGRVLANGDVIPNVQTAGFEPLFMTLKDEKLMRELPLELARTLPELRLMAVAVRERSEGLKGSLLGKFVGAAEKNAEEKGEKKLRKKEPEKEEERREEDRK
jgi:hypothetical protein